MKIVIDKNTGNISGFDVVEYDDGEIKYFDEFGNEIIREEINVNKKS